MKKIFVLIISLFCINTIYAQTASYNSVRKNKLSGSLETYITKFGKTIRVNDQVTIGKAYNFETYKYLEQVYLKDYKEITNYTQTFQLREAAEGYVLIIDKIIANSGIVSVYTRPSDKIIQVLVKDIDAAEFNNEIVIGPPSKNYPYIKENEVIGYYTSSKLSPMRVYFNKGIIDSLNIDEIKSEKLGIKDSISQPIAYNLTGETKSSFYLKKAGKSKNSSKAVMGLTALIGGAILSSNDPDNPDSNPSKIATPIFAIGGLISLILDVVGNNALIKAGEEMEIEKNTVSEPLDTTTTNTKP